MATELKGRRFSIDDEGKVTFRLRYLADSEDEALFSIPSTYRGLVRRGHNGGVWDGDLSKYVVDAQYEGLADTGTDPEEQDQYLITGEWREEPIEAFPDRSLLVRDYGAYVEDGKLKFPEKMPTNQAAEAASSALGFAVGFLVGQAVQAFGGGNSESGEAEDNPLFGVTTYPVFYQTAERSYVRSTVPSDVYRRVGQVLERLPDGFDYDGDAVAWFVDAPTVQKVGNANRIVERFKEVDKLKHVQALYALLRK